MLFTAFLLTDPQAFSARLLFLAEIVLWD